MFLEVRQEAISFLCIPIDYHLHAPYSIPSFNGELNVLEDEHIKEQEG